MSNNDWTNKLRDQLADYQESVGDDLWAGIEQSLAPTPKASAKTVFLRRLSIAAALSALAVGGTYVYRLSQADSDSPMVATLPAPQGKFKPVVDGIPSGLPSVQTANATFCQSAKLSPRQLSKTSSDLLSKPSPDFLAKATTGSSSDDEVELQAISAGSLGEAGSAVTENVVVTENKRQEPRMASASSSTVYESYPSSRRRQRSGVDINLYGENGMLAMNSTSASPLLASTMSDPVVGTRPPRIDDYMVENALFTSYKEAACREEIKHHQPISVGVQVGIGLAPRLKLTTGLVYTTTSSDFIGKVNGTVTTATQQKLSYVGIPVNLSYDVWSQSRLHTYVTVGGEGAVNVKNHAETDGLEIDAKRDRMQWSSQASVGIQYDVLPQVGVYVEPGAKYYFDNGSQVENVFKEKKLNFNFQFGLRWNLGE